MKQQTHIKRDSNIKKHHHVIVEEWLSICKNKKVLIPMIAILFIPLLYSFMFLWTFWDPYERMDVLPVAIVNEDAGATLDGEKISVGEEFIAELKESDDFAWNFVSKEQALNGMSDNEYYMTVLIPEQFSAQAASITDEQPEKAQLVFMPNESYNFLSAQIGTSAVGEIRDALSSQLSEAYVETVFDNINVLSDGLVEAADGASKVHEGTVSVEEGLLTMTASLQQMESGTAPLVNGTEQLMHGASDLTVGLEQWHSGAGSLQSGLQQLEDSALTLTNGWEQSTASLEGVGSGLEETQKATVEMQEIAVQLATGLEQLLTDEQLANNENIQQLALVAQQLSGGLENAAVGQAQLTAGMQELTLVQQQLNEGMDLFQLKLTEASSASEQLNAAGGQLLAGSQTLRSGLSDLKNGVDEMTTGTSQLASGSVQLSNGLTELVTGSETLSVQLAEAADQTQESTATESMMAMMASPVEVVDDKFTEVPNYGTGFSPYFISLGLFVGALLLTIIFDIRRPAVQPKNALHWFVSKWSVVLIVGVLQALIVDVVMLFGLGLEVQSVSQFIFSTVATSIVYMVLIQFLVTAFQDVGRFIAIVLLILQLTTSAGTFPLELIPSSLQFFNTWLPMTYSVDMFKAAISSGSTAHFWSAMQFIGMFAASMMVLTYAYFAVVFRKKAGEVIEMKMAA
ncbi:YhgE/Pip family protein [Longirhabdus pacifica]|uniref:YhgE/Pip family protein n=1 Tax=Longirhabdus pacifica TaxID=2305227 RepID=UPI0010093830|nr:YhgE/Pip domain-containing protein [Longirhabdus pacifica]